MLADDSYSTTSTNVELACIPDDTTGLERIMLAAQGDLQRLLSSYFGHPIFIELIYAHCSSRLTPASLENPITQSRQVHLVCSSCTVCIATSTVTITSPQCERLFLDEKFPIGQTFRRLNRTPKFSLLNVETKAINGKRELRRTYKLETEGFVAEILEVFPDRDMFVRGEAWLMERRTNLDITCTVATDTKPEWLSVRKGNVVH
ncbi:hypothetical protein DFJ58DRAFT_727946 [Suillus subalutaceus]|uniref:uncharacterized protein n=1 Tax=Suillus subalutaceus TaxID=48586 RepID=UPI001B86256A|nr:uncharacterized protein DFJ58DRAFT_727946 [Suillus subalutaceus]KAG1854152.1 hypothetical protein DFJ58DRAFT_727946 [Suillus subalutaceus]